MVGYGKNCRKNSRESSQKAAISKHLKNIFESKELEEDMNLINDKRLNLTLIVSSTN